MPACRAASTTWSLSPVVAGSRLHAKRWPRTAAARTTARGSSPIRARRSRMWSAKVAGTTGSVGSNRVHEDPSSAKTPDATAAARSSSIRNGTPAARSAKSSTAAGTSGMSRQEATSAATSSASRRDSSIRVATRRAVAARARSNAGDRNSSRSVMRQRMGSDARLSARYSTIDRVSGSAQCRSSSTTTQLRPPARARRRRSRASAIATTESSPRAASSARHSGINRPSTIR